MESRRWVWLLVAVLAVGGLGFRAAASPARGWTVVAGGATKDGSVLSNAFHPRVLDVAVGDVVEWRFEGFHNVAFAGGGPLPPLVVSEGGSSYLNPQVAFPAGPQSFDGAGYRNSGVPPEEPAGMARFVYRLRFDRPGTYTYTCIVHGPAMSGTVRVHPRGARLPENPQEAARRGRQEQQATLEAGRAALARLQAEVDGQRARVLMLGDAQAGYSLMRYTRTPLVVRRGTTVTWDLRDPFEVHTVTFVGAGGVPTFVIPQPQAGGPPKLLLNPRVMAPTGDRVHRPGYLNSGILMPMGAPGPHAFSLRFDRAGTYTYWCPVHAALGMKGTVVVR